MGERAAQSAEAEVLAAILEDPAVLEGAAVRNLMLGTRDGALLISVEDWLDQTGARLSALNAGAEFLFADGIEQADAAEAAGPRDL